MHAWMPVEGYIAAVTVEQPGAEFVEKSPAAG
jgi:hypothetical protein